MELSQLSFKVRGIPEEDGSKILLTYCADQKFHKQVGVWHVRESLHFLDVEDPEIRLPSAVA